MKVRIYFDITTDVPPHIADMDTVPQVGASLHLPDIDSDGYFPVQAVVFQLVRTQTQPEPTLAAPSNGVIAEVYLGPEKDRLTGEYRED